MGKLLYSTAFYAFSAPIWGYLVDNKVPQQHAIIIGHILDALAFTFMGPVPLLQSVLLQQQRPQLSQPVFGMSLGPFFILLIGAMRKYMTDVGIKSDFVINSIISELYGLCVNLGMVTGSIFGGLILQYSTFSWACMILVTVILVEGVVLGVFVFNKVDCTHR